MLKTMNGSSAFRNCVALAKSSCWRSSDITILASTRRGAEGTNWVTVVEFCQCVVPIHIGRDVLHVRVPPVKNFRKWKVLRVVTEHTDIITLPSTGRDQLRAIQCVHSVVGRLHAVRRTFKTGLGFVLAREATKGRKRLSGQLQGISGVIALHGFLLFLAVTAESLACVLASLTHKETNKDPKETNKAGWETGSIM